VAGNPRIEELRKKLDKEPGSRLFAQLAEELRKDGEFEDAIRVAREGLQKHQNYPSARLTLGRALFDTGDWAAARVEFEQVLKGAPDNILASRLLAESLEGLGDAPAAIARYKKTLALAPGDKQVLARLEALEGGGAASSRTPAPPGAPAPVSGSPAAGALRPPAPSVLPAPATPAEPPPVVDASAPIRLVEVDTPMELERPHERGSDGASAPEPVIAPPLTPETSAFAPAVPPPSVPAATWVPADAAEPATESSRSEPAPIPVAPADESFEIERPLEAPPMPPVETLRPASPPPAAPRGHEAAMEFEFEPGPTGSALPFAPAPAEAPVSAASPVAPPMSAEVAAAPAEAATPVESEVPPSPSPAAPPPATAAATTVRMSMSGFPTAPPPEGEPASGELMSPTLAELYFNQGFTDKAIEVYRQLLDREPDNTRLRRRLDELQAPRTMPPMVAPTPEALAVPPEVEPPVPAVPASAPMSTPEAEVSSPAFVEAQAAPVPPFVAPPAAGAAALSAAAAPSPEAARRVALERTIARLEGMLAAIKKG
jgi:hypothetical protein